VLSAAKGKIKINKKSGSPKALALIIFSTPLFSNPRSLSNFSEVFYTTTTKGKKETSTFMALPLKALELSNL
jgi:hypothetical protein